MPESQFKLGDPPIVELVLGVQFAPIKNFSSSIYGRYWKECLDSSWVSANDAPIIADQFELFGEQRGWMNSGIRLAFDDGSTPPRTQICTASRERMIQLQPSRFHFNWQKRENEYPHFQTVRREFLEQFLKLRRFIQSADFGDIVPNQWEITYVDHIPRGELWQTPYDWAEIFPSLFSFGLKSDLFFMESFGGEWHFEIPKQRGRLHVSVQYALAGKPAEPTLMMQSTARGPIDKQTDLITGIDLGHAAILKAFIELTSEKAKKAWKVEV